MALPKGGEGRTSMPGETGAPGMSGEMPPGWKPSNPKDSMGILKIAMSVMPMQVLFRIALGMLEGALKYGAHNYRVIGVRGSIYLDATFRHLIAYQEGEDLDPESKVGLHHIDKALSSLTVMRDAMLQGTFTDDRPPPSKVGWMDELNGKVKDLLAQYPEPVARYLAGGARGPGRRLEDKLGAKPPAT